ncbi:MAG: hypothetical protein LBT69_04425 [Lactobacillales bacterium]|jgi:competence protein ComGC|nr:hypothetical protein [Lactobacillales bacterium]
MEKKMKNLFPSTSTADYQKIKGFAFFESLLSLIIICILVIPLFTWFPHMKSLLKKEHEKLTETRLAYESLILKTNIKDIKLQTNDHGKIIGIHFSNNEVQLIE